MDVETALTLADELILTQTGKPMNDLQRLVFRGAWQGKSFSEIHQLCRDRCGLDHLMRNVGPELWRLLSEGLGTRVSKNHLQGPFEGYAQKSGRLKSISVAEFDRSLQLEVAPSAPDTVITHPATLSVERTPYEAQSYREIVQPGALIRIKAPQEMGKTWLMEKILAYARSQGYQTQTLSFDLADQTVYRDLERFSRWFCASVGQALKQPNQLDEYWQEIFACNYNSTIYFENYLLASLSQPLVLALDKVDRVFEHPEIAHDFCSLLRAWNQRAAQGDAVGQTWKNLRLIIVHATEVYGALDINQSPLGGVGLVLKLPELSLTQVEDLAQQYQLPWARSQVEQLMHIIGGHPLLVQRALQQMAQQSLTLEQFLQLAVTDAGPYSDHLRRHLSTLQQQPTLARAFQTVVMSREPVPVETLLGFKLESLGLVSFQPDGVTPRCELYRQYFRDRLPGADNASG